MYEENDSSVCKIGFSRDAQQRAVTLQTGNRRDLRVHREIRLENCDSKIVEQFLHNRYFNLGRHDNREWYQLSPEEVDQIDPREIIESIRNGFLTR